MGAGDRVQAIGVALEPATPLASDLWETALTQAEQGWLATCATGKRGQLAKILVSAKTCANRCQYPLTGVFLEADAFEVQLDPAKKAFHAMRAGSPVGSDPADRMTGRYSVLMGHVLCTLVLPRW